MQRYVIFESPWSKEGSMMGMRWMNKKKKRDKKKRGNLRNRGGLKGIEKGNRKSGVGGCYAVGRTAHEEEIERK